MPCCSIVFITHWKGQRDTGAMNTDDAKKTRKIIPNNNSFRFDKCRMIALGSGKLEAQGRRAGEKIESQAQVHG